MKYVLSLLLTVCFFSFSAKSNGTGKDIDVNHYEIHLKDFNSVEKSIVASTTITLTALNDIEKIIAIVLDASKDKLPAQATERI